MERITGVKANLLDFRGRAITNGTDAQGEVFVEIDLDGRGMSARALSTDIVEASAMAYLEIINRLVSRRDRERLKPTDHVPQDSVPTTS